MVSLLNKTGKKTALLGDGVIENLMLDRFFNRAIENSAVRKLFLSELKNLLLTSGDIKFRQELICDVQNNLDKFLEIKKLFDRMEDFFDEVESQRKQVLQNSKLSVDGSVAINSALVHLCAMNTQRIYRLIGVICEAFDNSGFISESILRLKARLHQITDSEYYGRLLKVAAKFEFFSFTQGYAEMDFDMDEFGRVDDMALIYDAYADDSDDKSSIFGKLFKSKSQEVNQVISFSNFDRDALLGNAVGNAVNGFENAVHLAIDEFGCIRREMDFCIGAMEYLRFLKFCDVPITYPDVAGDTHIASLYDPLLISLNKTNSGIIPNSLNFESDCRGIVITGGNGCGKTVYLRSVACAYILAQNGLPIPCNSAVIAPVSGIGLLMASSEKSVKGGEEAGRFEGEVREIAKLIDSLKPGNLVFFNEIFQTTAYSESSDELKCILDYLSDIGVRWITVTHLLKLAQEPWDGIKKMTAERFVLKAVD